MHNEFLLPGAPLETPAAREMLGDFSAFIGECRELGVRVIYTNHLHRPDGSDMGRMAELWPIVRDGLVNVPGTAGSRIHEAVAPRDEDIIVQKHRYSAFYGTDLEIVLRGMTVDTVVISGVLTNACCESTARDAMYRDFRVIFLSDLCATFDIPAYDGGTIPAEVVQRVVCSTIDRWFGEVCESGEVLARLRQSSEENVG
jgi:ureidoacrylate peracid hydrolase